MTRSNSIAELDWNSVPSRVDVNSYQSSSSAQLKAATSLLAHRYFSRHEVESRVTRAEGFVSNKQTAHMKSRLEALLR